ncbi:MAG: AMP-binding protein, partial [Gammaproteobacteria bacterium]
LLEDSGAQWLVSDQPRGDSALSIADQSVGAVHLNGAGRIPAQVSKITYTSGTTGQPKGVMLRGTALMNVATSLAGAARLTPNDTHAALMPLAVLLETIGGLYAPLLAGASIWLPDLGEAGLSGAAGVNGDAVATTLCAPSPLGQPTTTILLPMVLQALSTSLDAHAPHAAGRPVFAGQLRFAALGGASVSPDLIARARTQGLPVYEGYGLSECSSVLTLNRPGADRPGSVGKALPHVELRIAGDGEVWARGAAFEGYLHDHDGGWHRPDNDGWWPTGDLGELDDDGFLTLRGRKRNVFITALGRNVNPEWVERELTGSGLIRQAVVFGEARPFNAAVLVADADGLAIQGAIDAANARLPDYARIRHWIPANEPFSPANGLGTATGRPRREAIAARYQEPLSRLYESHTP